MLRMTNLSREFGPVPGSCLVLSKYSSGFHRYDAVLSAIENAIGRVGMTMLTAADIDQSRSFEDVWRALQEAEIVIADLRDRVPSIFFELGLAQAIGKRILLVGAQSVGELPEPLTRLRYLQVDDRSPQELAPWFEEALRQLRDQPSAESALIPLPAPAGPVEPMPATVVGVRRDAALVRAEGGREGYLHANDFSWVRKPKDLRRILKVGHVLEGAFISDLKGTSRYSLKAVQEDPWPGIMRDFPLHKPFWSRIVSITTAGLFVSLEHGVNGLIPRSLLAESRLWERGDRVEVYPVRIDPVAREVELRLVQRDDLREDDESPMPTGYEVGQQLEGTVTRVAPNGDFLLVQLPDGFVAILHADNMKRPLRDAVLRGEVQAGDRVRVGIADVDYKRRRVHLQDYTPLLSNSRGNTEGIYAEYDVPISTLHMEHGLLLKWARIEPLVYAAQRIPRARWKAPYRRFTPAQVRVIDQWFEDFRDEISLVRNVRSKVAHGIRVSSEEMAEAVSVADHLLASAENAINRRELSSSPKRGPLPQLHAELQDTGRNSHRLTLSNTGTVDVYDVDVRIPENASSFLLLTDELPIDVLRPGDGVKLPVALVMGGGPSIFDITLNGRTAEGEEVERLVKISI
jgi:small subunit ribosomal protein S1